VSSVFWWPCPAWAVIKVWADAELLSQGQTPQIKNQTNNSNDIEKRFFGAWKYLMLKLKSLDLLDQLR